MMPLLIVIPGIIPTTSPSTTPTAVAARLDGSTACAKPWTMSAFTAARTGRREG